MEPVEESKQADPAIVSDEPAPVEKLNSIDSAKLPKKAGPQG